MARRQANPFSLFSFQDIITGLCGIMILLVMVMVIDLALRRAAAGVPVEPETVDFQETDSLRAQIEALQMLVTNAQQQAEWSATATPVLTTEGAKRLAERAEQTQNDVQAQQQKTDDLERRLSQEKEEAAKLQTARRAVEERKRSLNEQLLSSVKDVKGVTLIPESGSSKSPVFLVLSRDGAELHQLDGSRKHFSESSWKSEFRSSLNKLDGDSVSVIVLVRPSGCDKMDDAVSVIKSAGFTYGRDPLEEGAEVKISLGGGAGK